ncbi:hypothetical protein [Pseudomonas sp. PNPG3]|uniref:hypothetical protein n=1 Tax=Pseudomonas sp. PNPG3 TaxID=2919497 RepID=UPI001FFC635E|nr:hypothetical protein [Pseudomonas sp. PNPG3]MCK2123885.1 hypothetical protein [Pseudomonas sp. PNPG3]
MRDTAYQALLSQLTASANDISGQWLDLEVNTPELLNLQSSHANSPREGSDDNPGQDGDTEAMNITREEIDAKLQLIEERLDRKVSDIATSVNELKASNERTVIALQNAKWWAIGTAIAVLAIFMGTLQWGLSAQKEENARFSGYIRDDIKSIGSDVRDISKAVLELRVKSEAEQGSPGK